MFVMIERMGADISWIETRDDATHPITHSTVLMTKNDTDPNANRAGVEINLISTRLESNRQVVTVCLGPRFWQWNSSGSPHKGSLFSALKVIMF